MKIVVKRPEDSQINVAIQGFKDKLDPRIRKGVSEAGKILSDFIKNRALMGDIVKSRTGQLRRDVRWKINREKDLTYTVTVYVLGSAHVDEDTGEEREDVTSADIAHFLIGGTDPHTIYGNPWLKFYWDAINKRVRFKEVKHPGFKARPFVQYSVDKTLPQMRQAIRVEIERG